MEHLSRTGIVDKVEAKRKKGEVVNLQATIRFDTGIMSDYDYDEVMKIDTILITFGALAGINPGDLVSFDMVVQSPMTQRFRPALEAAVAADDALITEGIDDDGVPYKGIVIGDEPEDQVDEGDEG